MKENYFALLADFRRAETRSGANQAFSVQKRFELRSAIATRMKGISQIPLSKLVIYGILILFILLHLVLLSKTMLYDSLGNMRAAIAGYGDIPFHLTQVSKFAYGSLFDLNEPIFSGTSIKYAFFINWISGFLFKLTHSLEFSFHFPGMLFAAAGTALTFFIYKKLLKKHWLALLAVIVFLLGSGFGAYSYITDQLIGQSMSVSEFADFLVDNNISTVTKWDAVYPRQNIAWGAPMTVVLLHQRAFLLGYFLFALFFYLLLKFKETEKRKFFYSLVAVLGLSPLAHYHSFLAMGFTTVVFAIFYWRKNEKELFKKLVWLLILAAILSLPEVIYLASGMINVVSGENSFIQPRLGWMANPTVGSVKYPAEPGVLEILCSYLRFLWANFGIMLPLFAAVVFWGLRKSMRHEAIKLCILAGLALFLLVQLFKFQPWDYDSNKLLVYYQFFAVPAMIFFLVNLRRKMIWLPIFFILATHSGIVDIIPRLLVPTEQMPVIFSKDAIDTAEFVRENIEKDSQILTTSTHLNPVNSLAGRPALVGYPGWLWTKGIDYSPRETDLKKFYADPDEFEILKKYGIKYILVDPVAVYDWKAQKSEFDARFLKIYEKGPYSVYKVMGL